MSEVWLPVVDYEGLYEVSNLGRIRRKVSGRILQPAVSRGYPHVSLSKDNVIVNMRVHKAVMFAFCGREPFPGAQVCHNDGDKTNSVLTNLRWDSANGNQADIVRHGTRCKGSDVFGAKLDDEKVQQIRKLILAGYRNPPIAEDFDVSISTVHLIRHNRTWKHVPWPAL